MRFILNVHFERTPTVEDDSLPLLFVLTAVRPFKQEMAQNNSLYQSGQGSFEP